MNNTKYDPEDCKNKKEQNLKFSSYILNQNSSISCFPVSASLNERNTPPVKAEDIDIESSIRGYRTPLSRAVGVKESLPYKKVQYTDCNFITKQETREPRVNKLISEIDTSNFNYDYLPYDVQSGYRNWDYINSRQMIKDIQENVLKNKK